MKSLILKSAPQILLSLVFCVSAMANESVNVVGPVVIDQFSNDTILTSENDTFHIDDALDDKSFENMLQSAQYGSDVSLVLKGADVISVNANNSDSSDESVDQTALSVALEAQKAVLSRQDMAMAGDPWTKGDKIQDKNEKIDQKGSNKAMKFDRPKGW